MHDINTQVARPDDSQQGVEVGAVHVEQGTVGVQGLGDGHDVGLKDAQGVGIGHHQGRHVRSEVRAQLGEADGAVGAGGDLLDLVTGEMGRGRVGAVRRIGNQHDLARDRPSPAGTCARPACR